MDRSTRRHLRGIAFVFLIAAMSSVLTLVGRDLLREGGLIQAPEGAPHGEVSDLRNDVVEDGLGTGVGSAAASLAVAVEVTKAAATNAGTAATNAGTAVVIAGGAAKRAEAAAERAEAAAVQVAEIRDHVDRLMNEFVSFRDLFPGMIPPSSPGLIGVPNGEGQDNN